MVARDGKVHIVARRVSDVVRGSGAWKTVQAPTCVSAA